MTQPAERAAALEIVTLSKSFYGNLALHPFSMRIETGEVHALVGENGSGKSTTIKILSGNYRPDPGGQVWIGGHLLKFGSPESSYALGARFVQQDLGLVDSSSILDNVCITSGFETRWGTVKSRALRATVQTDLDALSIDAKPDMLVRDLTVAQKTGVAVARALRKDPHSQARLIVLDEPTATLPEDEVAHLLSIVRQVAASGVAVLYVTHRLDEIFEVADNITVLRDGREVATRPVRDLDRPTLVNLLVGRELGAARAVAANRRGDVQGAPVLTVDALGAGPLQDFSMVAREGEIVGIAGITGSGRESVLSVVFGGTPRDGGRVQVSGRTIPSHRPTASIESGMAYLPPDRKLLGGIVDAPALDNFTLANLRPFRRLLSIWRKPEMAEGKTWFDRLGVRPSGQLLMRFGDYSGGNQQKILVGKWLRCRPGVFLLDEPTQGVDIGAKADLYPEIIRAAEEGSAVVVASSDIADLTALCDRVIVLRGGRIVAEIVGADITAESISRESLGTGS